MLIYFVRHGQTNWNKALRWQGLSDVLLNAVGEKQAQNARQALLERRIRPALIISSPLQRAKSSAVAIASAFSMNVLIEPAFIELDLGEFEGKTTDELTLEYGSIFEQWLQAHHTIASPGGEDLAAGIERVAAPLQRYITEQKSKQGGDIIIVAHQAILMAMKAALSGKQSKAILARFKQANNEIDVWDVKKAEIKTRLTI